MSKLKRLKRKQALQKKANIRRMALNGNSKETLGSHKLLERMSRDHLDVLQNIEFSLVSRWREDESIDDGVVADALKAAIYDDVPESACAQSLGQGLEAVRRLRADVSDDTWRAGLQAVLQSVHRHSSLRPGARGYLHFVSDFIL